MGKVMEPSGGVVLPQNNVLDLTIITKQLEINAQELMKKMTEHFKKLMESTAEWISVNDRLPPNDCFVSVAIWHEHKSYPMYFISIGKRMNSEWFDHHDGEPLLHKNSWVSHWMPLSDDPSKERR